MRKTLVVILSLFLALTGLVNAPAASAGTYEDAWHDLFSSDRFKQARAFEAIYAPLWEGGQKGLYSEVQRAANELAANSISSKRRACYQVNAEGTLRALKANASNAKSVGRALSAIKKINTATYRNTPARYVATAQSTAWKVTKDAAVVLNARKTAINGFYGAYYGRPPITECWRR